MAIQTNDHSMSLAMDDSIVETRSVRRAGRSWTWKKLWPGNACALPCRSSLGTTPMRTRPSPRQVTAVDVTDRAGLHIAESGVQGLSGASVTYGAHISHSGAAHMLWP